MRELRHTILTVQETRLYDLASALSNSWDPLYKANNLRGIVIQEAAELNGVLYLESVGAGLHTARTFLILRKVVSNNSKEQ